MNGEPTIFETADKSLTINEYKPLEKYRFNPSSIPGWNKAWTPKIFTVISAEYNGNELIELVIKYDDENSTHTFEPNKSIHSYSAPFSSIVLSTHPTKIHGISGGKRRKSRKSRKCKKSRKTRRRRR